MALSPKSLTPAAVKVSFCPLNAVKFAVVTLLLSKLAMFPETSIILIEPSGSMA